VKTRRHRLKTVLFLMLIPAGLALLFVFFPFFEKKELHPQNMVSLRLLDRQGVLLREVLSQKEGTCFRAPLDEVSPFFISALLTAEDKRFYRHPGVDVLALIRASRDNLREHRIVSGGSTITQQLARNIYGLKARNIFNKVVEMLLALRLEAWLSKNDILELYLNRVSFGNQTYGIEAASRLYFGKSSAHLSLAESTLLAVIPRSPLLYDPFSRFKEARKRQLGLLKKMRESGEISAAELRRAIGEKIRLQSPEICFQAPHLCDYILQELHKQNYRGLSEIKTTLNLLIQEETERLLKYHIDRLKDCGVSNGAVLIMDNATGEVLAMAGSYDYFSKNRQGQVNGTLALRQPGSALKPFTYALAFEKKKTPADLVADIETHVPAGNGDFTPLNYDEKYHGPVRLRTALACSYNVSAVRILRELGPASLLERLHLLGVESLREDAAHYGLGLTLGNGEVRLLELVNAYRCLANGGFYSPEKIFFSLKDSKGSSVEPREPRVPHGVFSPKVAYLVTDILADNTARVPAFGAFSPLHLPFPCAAKTGTSKGFRDNWTVGYTSKYTVGVWVGNFEGRAMNNVSGITGAGPLFRDLMLFLHERSLPQELRRPAGLVLYKICPVSGELPGPYCRQQIEEIFIRGRVPGTFCSMHRSVTIDRRTGLPAMPYTPISCTAQKIYTAYPPQYYSWMKDQGIEMPAFTKRPSQKSSTKIAISFPLEGEIFKIDPDLRREYQNLQIKAVVPAGISKVGWWVDGVKVKEADVPFTLSWKLERGTHSFRAIAIPETHQSDSDPVRIQVY